MPEKLTTSLTALFSDAFKWFVGKVRTGEYVECPICKNVAAIQVYALDRVSCTALQVLYDVTKKRKSDSEPVYINLRQELLRKNKRSMAYAHLRFWELIEQGKVLGLWRITDKGRLYVEGHMALYCAVRTFNNRFIDFDTSKTITFKDAMEI